MFIVSMELVKSTGVSPGNRVNILLCNFQRFSLFREIRRVNECIKRTVFRYAYMSVYVHNCVQCCIKLCKKFPAKNRFSIPCPFSCQAFFLKQHWKHLRTFKNPVCMRAHVVCAGVCVRACMRTCVCVCVYTYALCVRFCLYARVYFEKTASTSKFS